MFRQILDQGWVDAIRTLHPDAPMYTFWDCMRNRWLRDAGLRIDHLLLSKEASSRLTEAGVDRDVRGVENASDYTPAWIVLRDDTMQRSRRGAASRAGKPPRSKARAAAPNRPASRAGKPPRSKARAAAPNRPLLVIERRGAASAVAAMTPAAWRRRRRVNPVRRPTWSKCLGIVHSSLR
jgi:hypothetical protein